MRVKSVAGVSCLRYVLNDKTNAKIIKTKEPMIIFKKWFKTQALPADQLC